MRNALTIARFEVKTRLKRISTWVYFAVFFALAMFWVAAAGGIIKSAVVSFGSGKVWIDSPYAIAQTVSFLGMFGLSIIAARVTRRAETPHRIGVAIDAGRDKVAGDLAGGAASRGTIRGYGGTSGVNGDGNPFQTDGQIGSCG